MMKRILVFVGSVALFIVCSRIAFEQRGYWAVGGEYFALAIPLVYALVDYVNYKAGGDK